VARVEDYAAGAGSLHDVDRTVQRHGPADEVELHDEVVVLMQREAGDAVDIVGAVHDVLDRSDRPSCVIQPYLAAAFEEVDEVVIERPRRVERRAVDRVRLHVLERVALRRGADRRGGGDSEREREDGETDENALHDRLLRCGQDQPNLLSPLPVRQVASRLACSRVRS